MILFGATGWRWQLPLWWAEQEAGLVTWQRDGGTGHAPVGHAPSARSSPQRPGHALRSNSWPLAPIRGKHVIVALSAVLFSKTFKIFSAICFAYYTWCDFLSSTKHICNCWLIYCFYLKKLSCQLLRFIWYKMNEHKFTSFKDNRFTVDSTVRIQVSCL